MRGKTSYPGFTALPNQNLTPDSLPADDCQVSSGLGWATHDIEYCKTKFVAAPRLYNVLAPLP